MAPKESSKSKDIVEKKEKGIKRSLSPFEEMDRMFDSFFPRGWLRPQHWERPSWGEMMASFESQMPRVDIIDRDDEVVVHAEVPGVDKDDLEVSVTDNTVTIKASTSQEKKEEKGDYYRCETKRGSFSRTLALPSDIDCDKAKSSLKDGVLELRLPKIAKSKRRQIKVE